MSRAAVEADICLDSLRRAWHQPTTGFVMPDARTTAIVASTWKVMKLQGHGVDWVATRRVIKLSGPV